MRRWVLSAHGEGGAALQEITVGMVGDKEILWRGSDSVKPVILEHQG